MSKYAVYVGKNPSTSSMYLVGSHISEFLGGCPIIRSGSEIKGAETVICIVVEDLAKLHEGKRFTGFSKLIGFFAANVEEFPEYDIFRLFGMVCTGVLSKLVVHSPHSYERLEQLKRKYLSPKQYHTCSTKISMSLWGIEPRFTLSFEGRNPKKFIAPFNRVSQVQKRVREHAEVTLYVKVKAKDTQHLFICGGLADHKAVPEVYDKIAQGSREDYVQTLRDVGVSVCTSQYESFGIYYLELMASGVVVLFLREGWVEKLLPSYPLMFDTQLALSCAAVAVTDPETFKAYQRLLQTYVESDEFKRFTLDGAKQRFLEAIAT